MLLKRVITFILTLLILFADSGQTIYAHTCLKSKHTNISIGAPKGCCAEKNSASHCTLKKSSCCEVSSKLLKQGFINQPTTEAKAVTLEAKVLPTSQLFVFSAPQSVIPNLSNTSPPPVLCKSENTFTQTFRI